jgi:hypothetical protein
VFSSDIDRNPDRRGADDYGKVSPTAVPSAATMAFMDVRGPA